MGVKIRTIKEIRFLLARELKGVYNDQEIRSLADILIKTVTGSTRLHEIYNSEHIVSPDAAEKIIRYTDELKAGRPVQYIVGETTFYNCMLKLNSSTLIPRPETEELVDLIIKENKGFNGTILDIGSGSGCIAIALAVNLSSSIVTGVELSDEAVRISRENADLNNVKVSFLQGDILTFDPGVIDKAGIIVSNPPYVMNSEKTKMAKNVLDFEPPLALFVSDSDPLLYYRAILKLAEKVLLPGGRLYCEINEAMGGPMVQLLKLFDYTEIEIALDINEKERIIKGRKNG
jgi:release factor glutamine methyltransferase